MYFADLINFNRYYPESNEICEVYRKLQQEEEQERLNKFGHPDEIYFKKTVGSTLN